MLRHRAGALNAMAQLSIVRLPVPGTPKSNLFFSLGVEEAVEIVSQNDVFSPEPQSGKPFAPDGGADEPNSRPRILRGFENG